eukprot:260828_1
MIRYQTQLHCIEMANNMATVTHQMQEYRNNSMTFDAYTRVLVCRRCCYTDPSVVQPLVGVIRSSAVYNQVLSADAVSKRYESSTVTIDVPIPCTRTSGAASSGNPSQSNVTCASASDT